MMSCNFVPFMRGPLDGPFTHQLVAVYQIEPNTVIEDLKGVGSISYIRYIDRTNANYPTDFSFIIRNKHHEINAQINIDGELRFFDFFDWDNNSVKELWLVYEKNDSCFVLICDSDGRILIEHFLYSGKPRNEGNTDYPWLGRINSIHYKDLDLDGNNEFIVVANEGFAAKPRGIFAFHGQTFELLWKYEIGPPINLEPAIIDFDQDGLLEILISTDAPDNHNSANSTADSISYVILLSHDGNLKWKKEYGAKFSQVYAVAQDMDNNDKLEIVVMLGDPGTVLDPQIRLEYLNPQSRKAISNYPFPKNTNSSFLVVQAKKDAKKEILVSDENGSIILLDSQLNPIKEKQFPKSIRLQQNISDLNGDGLDEIIIATPEGRFLLDYNLEIIAKLNGDVNFLGNFKFYLHPRRNATPLLATYYEDKTVYSELVHNPYYTIQLIFPWFVLILISGTGYFIITWIPRTFNRIRFLHRVIGLSFARNYNAIFLINQGFFISEANQEARELLDITNKKLPFRIKDLPESVKKIKDALDRLKEKSPTKHVIKIRRNHAEKLIAEPLFKRGSKKPNWLIVSQTDHINAWSKSAQKIAHDIKTPLSSVALNLHSLQERLEKEKLADKAAIHDDIEIMKKELNRVGELTKSFLKFVDLEKPKFQVVDLKETVQHSVNHFKTFLNDQLSIETHFDEDAIETWADPQQIEQVFQILIENSIDALRGDGKIQISTVVFEPVDEPSQKMIQIEVTDTGPGIDSKDIEKVFDPSFTTKQDGTGMGLAIAKKTIEDHGGEIDVYSRKGLGTTFRFTLQKYNGENS